MGQSRQQRRCLSASWVVGVPSESMPALPVLGLLHNQGPFEGGWALKTIRIGVILSNRPVPAVGHRLTIGS